MLKKNMNLKGVPGGVLESLAALPLYNPASDIADGLVSVSSQYNFSSWCFAID
jgi:hypothetical protein